MTPILERHELVLLTPGRESNMGEPVILLGLLRETNDAKSATSQSLTQQG